MVLYWKLCHCFPCIQEWNISSITFIPKTGSALFWSMLIMEPGNHLF